MRSPKEFMVSPANYFVLGNDDTPDHRIGFHPALPLASFIEGKLHVMLIFAGHGFVLCVERPINDELVMDKK
jgi:hypothetical protein